VALFSIGDDKSPGPNGFSSMFFKKAWDVIGSDFCATAQNFFCSCKLLRQVNHSIIDFVPKSAHVSSPNDFKPISYCNVIYKVISKILTARITGVLETIISPL